MAVTSDVYEQDGGLKLHPYLVALARWCVSCLWSTATAMLCRLLANPLPQITASKPSKPRPAGKEHLHPEPKVECVVLHQPDTPRADVIFVHGLYGSLGNTWRQGEWRSKYKIEPNRVPLRRPNSIPVCACDRQKENRKNESNTDERPVHTDANGIKESENENILNFNDKQITFNIDGYYKKITNDDMFITEKFFNDTGSGTRIDNYETQAKFVRDLFATNLKIDEFDKHVNVACLCQNKCEVTACSCRVKCEVEGCLCRKKCEVGCGCVCDDCYSSCWPKDWIKVDYPDARVISVNYTSDPHLWRPLWIKESKRLHLHERAEQMTEQLISLGVGERPIVWVGHSKGGLFIKQIYCEAYEAYMKLNGGKADQNCDEYEKENELNHTNDNMDNELYIKEADVIKNAKDSTEYEQYKDLRYNKDNEINSNVCDDRLKMDDSGDETRNGLMSSNEEEDSWQLRSRLWENSAGFMFYSVPHRGSPLADIKTPLTARSVELQEMGRDCSLVTHLHSRWLSASSLYPPLVRSLVETSRTLMAVLWLRIVSVDSADAGIGALCGVSVDHREICKPSSRRCILYTELSSLIHAALEKCQQ